MNKRYLVIDASYPGEAESMLVGTFTEKSGAESVCKRLNKAAGCSEASQPRFLVNETLEDNIINSAYAKLLLVNRK